MDQWVTGQEEVTAKRLFSQHRFTYVTHGTSLTIVVHVPYIPVLSRVPAHLCREAGQRELSRGFLWGRRWRLLLFCLCL